MNLINGIAGAAISVRDRGLAYGDGVFRTFPVRQGKPVWWQRQYAKLAQDCAAHLHVVSLSSEALIPSGIGRDVRSPRSTKTWTNQPSAIGSSAPWTYSSIS